MSIDRNLFHTQGYLPAELREGKRWEVVYYALNPQTGKLARKQIRCNRIVQLSLRRAYAKKLCHEINVKLASGWNPFLEQETSKGFVKLVDAIQTFKAEKNKELREDSTRCYNSYIKTINEWLELRGENNLYCISFTKQHALDLLSNIYTKQKISNRTWNGYLAFYRTLFNWMLEREYCKVNHFTKLSKKKAEEKQRKVIPGEMRIKIENHLRKNDLPFLCIAMLCYGCLIRPKEILHLKPGDFLIKDKMLKIPPNVAKTGKARDVAMPDYVIKEILKLNLEKIPADYYVFSNEFRPGKQLKNTRDIGRYWQKLRNTLNIPENISFYSLKDSGITDLLNAGVAPKVVQHHAGHSSIEQTMEYDHKDFNIYKDTILNLPTQSSQKKADPEGSA